jgi:hypothetical protein
LKLSQIGLFVLLLGSALAVHAACTPNRQKIIIYQPWASHASTNTKQTKTITEELNKSQFTHVLFQWNRHGNQRFWLDDAIGRVPKQIKQSAQQLIEGLYADPDYFQALKRSDAELDAYLASLRENHLMVASALSLQESKNISGWYLPEEIDDLNWRSPQRQQMISNHFKNLVAQLKALNPNAPVYASTFFGGHSSPQDYANLLKKIHQDSGIIWLVQDGLGVRRHPQPNTRQYLHIIKRTLPTASWLGLLETFTELDQTDDNRFCPATRKEVETRRKLWCRATGKEPEVYFSLNQFNNQLLGHQNMKCKSRDGHFAATSP